MFVVDTPVQAMESSTPNVNGPVYWTAFSWSLAKVLVDRFFYTGDLGRCTPLFFLGINDEPTNMLTASCIMGTHIIYESLSLKISIEIGSTNIPHQHPQFHPMEPQPYSAI